MKHKHSQILIIGDGPCGLSAAIYAAQQGLSVSLLSAKPEKSISSKSLQSLYPDIQQLLKIISSEEALVNAECGRYEGVSINGKYTPLRNYPNSPDFGIHINREIFDETLLQQAIKLGVQVIPQRARKLFQKDSKNCEVMLDNNECVTANFLIDASGLNRFIGRQLKLTEIQHSPELVASTGTVVDTKGIIKENDFSFYTEPQGWHWLIKDKNNHIIWTKLSLKKDHNLDKPHLLQDSPEVGKTSAQNMTWRSYQDYPKGKILLAGDAANNIDPAAGQGVFNAIASGIKAAQTIEKCIKNPDSQQLHLNNYNSWLTSYFESRCNELRSYYQQLGIKLIE